MRAERFNRREEAMRLIERGINEMWSGRVRGGFYTEGIGFGLCVAAFWTILSAGDARAMQRVAGDPADWSGWLEQGLTESARLRAEARAA